MARSSRSGPRQTARRHRLRTRLHLQVFEDRCVPTTVSNLSDNDPGSLRDAIATTPAGETVDFQPGLTGTITLTSGELDISQNLTITGPGAGVITVSGNSASRVFEILGSRTVAISGLTITDGMTFGDGGGIDSSTATVTVTDSILSGNISREWGGGIHSTSGTVTVTHSILSGNEGFMAGGGIGSNGNATVTVTDSTFSGNSVLRSSGGGIWNFSGTVTVTHSILSGNSTATNGSGGAIFAGGSLTVIDSTISGNLAGLGGGGIHSGRSLTIINSTISGNSARNESAAAIGGGISSGQDTTITNSIISDNSASGEDGEGGGIGSLGDFLTISNSTLSGNSASGIFASAGGGIYNDGTLTVTDSTLSANSSGASGGGIFIHNDIVGSTVTITSSTLSGNFAASGGGIAFTSNVGPAYIRNTIAASNTAATFPDVTGALTSQGHNLIGDGTGGSGFVASDLVGSAQNPIDPRLGPLANNGGPTQTMALLPGSRAIDAGDNTDAPEWDQRGPGFPRIVNGIIDIGAFEVQQAVAPTVTCSVAQSLLWPPKHQLVNVGLSVIVDPPDANLHLLVYANDNASPADAAAIGPDTLQLRSERQGNGTGRVYLIVVTATNSGGTSFDVCTVAVPHDHSPRSIASAQQQAAAAEAYYREFQTTPPGYRLLGEGQEGGGAPSSGRSGKSAITGDIFRLNAAAAATPLASSKQSFLWSICDATVPTEHLLSTWASEPVDGYFANSYEEGVQLITPRLSQTNWDESSSPALDLLLMDDRWVV
jgi:hypothetical protein